MVEEMKLSVPQVVALKYLKGKLAERKNELGYEAWDKNGSSPIPKSERREGILEAMQMIDDMVEDLDHVRRICTFVTGREKNPVGGLEEYTKHLEILAKRHGPGFFHEHANILDNYLPEN